MIVRLDTCPFEIMTFHINGLNYAHTWKGYTTLTQIVIMGQKIGLFYANIYPALDCDVPYVWPRSHSNHMKRYTTSSMSSLDVNNFNRTMDMTVHLNAYL